MNVIASPAPSALSAESPALKAQDLEHYLRIAFPQVQTRDHCGYRFFFAGAGHHLPFASLADSDNPYDQVSDLDRPEVFRVNFALPPPPSRLFSRRDPGSPVRSTTRC